ncbi:sensor histidine kinase [Luteimicrobium subarcticum]|uniref:histidine kinase n=1 Tax=Luteimicrobium subarcticum TaxID=620910 RepID=A0A2M8W714_9MICO|nr:histidine kinase [Luteimicrobium subarcticum]PJI86716.1 signal transduction histidine kinase [Luteimicrobium subarcticum]
MPVRPDPFAPPLTRWGTTWRLTLCLLLSVLTWSQVADAEATHRPVVFWADLVLGAASFVVVLRRRQHPFTIALVLACFGTLSEVSSGPAALALVSLATRRELPRLVVVGAAGVAAGTAFDALVPHADESSWWLNMVFSVIVTAALVVWGMYIGSRRELLWSLRDRADQAEQQQELRVERARDLERERIAREMHDVLAHRISLISMHAGALAYRTDLPPEQVRETAALVSEKAHEALAELREVLGVLRETEPTRPQPTLVDVQELVDEAAVAGARVRLEVDVADPAAVPDRTGRTAYRVVQEALTNARKHAPGSPVTVTVSGDPGAWLHLVVRNGRNGLANPSERTGAGLGLVGMRERVQLAGGRLEVRADPGLFALEAWLPWQAGQADPAGREPRTTPGGQR